ncbi:AAA family ATPase [soil metagenome]
MNQTHYGLGNLENQRNAYATLKNKGHANVGLLKKYINQPEYNKPVKTFTISEVERMLDIPRSTIRDKEKNADIVYQDSTLEENGLKKHYRLNDIREIRRHFGKGFFNSQIERDPDIKPFILAFSMFKGGVGKTTQATHFAAHCALSGLRTLLIDLDPQASATFVFGYIPSIDIEKGNTIFSTLLEDPHHIQQVIRPTHYDGLDIITSGLELQAADLMLPNEQYNNQQSLGAPLLRLHNALKHIEHQYDVIILDCAPNHASTTMNALAAADGVIIPVTPNMLSYGSSIQFLQTLEELADVLLKYQLNKLKSNSKELFNNRLNRLFRVLITNDPGDAEAQDVNAAIRNLYGDFILPRPMIRSIALSRSSNDLGLLYDIKRTDVRGSKEAFDRGIACMKSVNDDLLTLLRSIWGLSNV